MPRVLRFISYVYAYTGNSKENNKGFIKVETTGPACKIEIHLKDIPNSPEQNTIYLFAQKGNFIQKIEIGKSYIESGMLNFVYRGKKDNIEESGVAIQEMEGVYIPQGEHKYCLSLWKENEFSEEVLLGEPMDKDNQEQQTFEKNLTEMDANKIEPLHIKEEEKTEIGKEDVQTEKDMENQDEDTQENPPDLEATETTREQSQPIHYYDRLKARLPIFFPFEGEPIECLKMELPDIRELPRTCWYFTNNSFLLHGFFSYHYFILGLDRTGEEEHYFLGVPGVFSHQERVMATLFGFPDFQPVKKSNDFSGQFGFWYRIIE